MARTHFSLVVLSLALFLLMPVSAQTPDTGWLPASPENLPRWRGFNLLNKFQLANSTPFEEADFRMIHGWGFNFVRLPMDYRIWIVNGDWTRINDDVLKDVDQAIAWGEKYHVHVCLNFHRAPGYTVAEPHEKLSVWTDPEAQRVCALHWAAFAKRYKGIPNERLSFDLFNEPANIDGKTYADVVAKIAAAIRAEDPGRLIICDGLQWGNVPVPELIPLHVAQATRGYTPMELTHYQASWMPGSSDWPVPTWFMYKGVSDHLYGPDRKDLHSALTLKRPRDGKFAAGTRLDLRVGTVSVRGHLVVRADDAVIFEKTYVPGSQAGPGEKVVYNPEYKIYQNLFSDDLSIPLPRDASRIAISNDDGDWMSLESLALRPGPDDTSYLLPLSNDWGNKQGEAVIFQPDVAEYPWSGGGEWIDRNWLYDHQIAPWRRLGNQGVGIMVGEWGCYNKTPYAVTLKWMEDNLTEFQTMGWGWALWNLKGSFGILDSDRPGAVYVDFQGHKLDARMLELLQKH